MPSPVGHALGGLIVSLAGARRDGSSPKPGARGAGLRLVDLTLPIVAAVAPDLDFFWGRHNAETHSLGAALLAAVVVWLWRRDARLSALVGLAWATHPLFDWLGSDDTPPLGVMALWPLSSEYYFAHAYVFEAISRRTHLPNFWPHNLWAVAWEVMLLTPLAALAAWWRWRDRGENVV